MQQKHVHINPISFLKSGRKINSTKCRKWAALLILIIGFHSISFAQKLQLEWANRMGGTGILNIDKGGDDSINDVVTDSSGNVYITGQFFGTTVFDSTSNTPILTSKAGNHSAFIAKYDPRGNCIWAVMMGGEGKSNVNGKAITLNNKGQLSVTGTFKGNVDFNGGTGINTLTNSETTNEDAFLAMFDTTGKYIWARRIGIDKRAKNDQGLGVANDLTGNVYVSGSFNDTVHFVGSGGTYQLIAKGGKDGFIAKYNESGNCLWARRIGSNQSDENSSGVAVDGTGNVYVLGKFSDTADFGIGSATLTSNGGTDGYLVKYDSSGNYLWALKVGGSFYESTSGLVVNASGEVFITGDFMGAASFNTQNTAILTVGGGGSSMNPFIAKYDADGNYLWAVNISASEMSNSKALALDNTGNVYNTGTYQGTADFDPINPGKFIHTALGGGGDIYLARYDGDNGHCLWAESIGGPLPEFGLGVDVDHSGNVFFCGLFKNSTDFDPGPNTAILNILGHQDGFLIKFVCADTSSSYITVRECNDRYNFNGQDLTENGIYTQHLPNAVGCDSTLTLELLFVNMEEPVISVDTLTLSTAQDNYQTYQWIKNGIAIPGATQNKYIVSENADYQVAVTGGEGCLDTSEIYTVKNVVSINAPNNLGQHIQIYPNPADDILHISSPIKINIHLFSIEGRLIQSVENGSRMSLKDLANGVYLIQITNKAGNVLKYEKVVKQ